MNREPRFQRQAYQALLVQTIEDYKNSLSREALVELGNQAVADLQNQPDGPYFLTESLMHETVDRIIMQRLRLPSFERWRTTRAE